MTEIRFAEGPPSIEPLGPGLDPVGIEARRQVALVTAAEALQPHLGRSLPIGLLTREDRAAGARGVRILPGPLRMLQDAVDVAVRQLDCGWRVLVEPFMDHGGTIRLTEIRAQTP